MKLSIAQKILLGVMIPSFGFGLLFSLMANNFESTASYVFILSIVGLITSVFTLSTCMVLYDMSQTEHTLLRVYPLVARLRWLFESERPKIQQYFVESDLDGTPYNREKRSDIYQKAKGEKNTTPFGTQLDVYKKGHEFLKHSIYPKDVRYVSDLRFIVGSKFCTKPYNSSIFGISGMSFGSLSKTAIESLNGGSRIGNFHHNTGEGGLTEYHLKNGGDIVFQFGTGYFGCGKDIDGVRYFDDEIFKKSAIREEVKMIELKLSQGAKPGHGGVLPAISNTPEIAKIRGLEKSGVTLVTPSYHTAFNDSDSLLDFVMKLRDLSGGKPVGIKMCVGDYDELRDLISLMESSNRYPDFITVDGAEGGTGAAPIIYANKIGTPLTEGLLRVNYFLRTRNLRDEVKVYASGKASDSFDIIKLLSLGADGVNAARAFMMSMGCIQARECGNCPVGIATQKESKYKKLDPSDKKHRVYNYHEALMHEVKEVIGTMSLTSHTELKPKHIYVREADGMIKTYEEIYNNLLY